MVIVLTSTNYQTIEPTKLSSLNALLGGFALTGKIEFLPYVEVLNANPPIVIIRGAIIGREEKQNKRARREETKDTWKGFTSSIIRKEKQWSDQRTQFHKSNRCRQRRSEERQTYRQIIRQTDRQTDVANVAAKRDRHTDRQTIRQTGKQTNRQMSPTSQQR